MRLKDKVAVITGAGEATRKHIKSLRLELEKAYIDFGKDALIQGR